VPVPVVEAVVSGKYILDEHGEPVSCDDTLAWGRWFEAADRQLAHDEIEGGGRVSTVFLGLDHNFGGGPPLLWETMVFGGPLDGEGDRYASRTAALRGHAAMLARALSARAP
jgi:hypothetical protein